MRIKSILLVVLVGLCFVLRAQYQPQQPGNEYNQIQNALQQGWNTWNAQNILSHVLLPQGVAINLSFKGHWNFYLDKGFPTINRMHEVDKRWPYTAANDRSWKNYESYNRPEQIKPGLRADDGSYTSLLMNWYNMDISIETATDGPDWLAVIKASNAVLNNNLVVEAGMMWNRPGLISHMGDSLTVTCPQKVIVIKTNNTCITDYNVPCNNAYLAIALTDNEIILYTGKKRSNDEVKQMVAAKRAEQITRAHQYGNLSESFMAMQQVLAWNTMYDAENNRVITPVSRIWCANWGGWMLFDWDTYFASYMLSLFNKNLAYSNVFAVTKSITSGGFIPNYAKSYNDKSAERSQPPVGSMVVVELYRKYADKWLLQQLYPDLLTWNRWWPKARDNNGFLCWGSNHNPNSGYVGTWQDAAYESGLDNAPMFDGVPFNNTTQLLELTDVGLMGMYIADCNALAEIANVLGYKKDVSELQARARWYQNNLEKLWDNNFGLYLNKRTDTLLTSYRLSPCNFYPLLTGKTEPDKLTQMLHKHYYNPAEFYGEYVMPSCARNDTAFQGEYWRGRIWGPMNMLVYMGLCQYPQANEARKHLAEQSNKMFVTEWKKEQGVFENYCAISGQGPNSTQSDSYYHWGALCGFMAFIENGFVPMPLQKLNK